MCHLSVPLHCLYMSLFIFFSSAQGEKQAAVPPPTSVSDGGEKQNVAAQLHSAQKGECRCPIPACVAPSATSHFLCKRSVFAGDLPCPYISPGLLSGLGGAGGGERETLAALNHRFNGGQRCMRAVDMYRPV